MSDKIGFRTEQAYGSGVRDAVEVMRHEIFDLMNAGIPERLRLYYRKLLSKIALAHCVAIVGDIIIASEGKPFDLEWYTDEYQKQICQQILDDINEHTCKNYKYALWLCESINDVLKFYNDNNECEVDAYYQSDMLIDVLPEGVLCLYEDEPKPIHRYLVTDITLPTDISEEEKEEEKINEV